MKVSGADPDLDPYQTSLIHNTRQKGGKGDHKVRNNTHQKKVRALI
jgi:hypothetical protein